jgi:hypothetical protein
MKIWLLTPGPNTSAWSDGDNAEKFVIRADTEEKARWYADTQGGQETITEKSEIWRGGENHPWLDPKQSACMEIIQDGRGGIIFVEYTWD